MRKDRRTQYTDSIIRDTYLEMLHEMPFTKITIKDLCIRADINRGTFYLHYPDMLALRQSIENEVIQKALKQLPTAIIQDDLNGNYITEMFLNGLEHLKKEPDIALILLNSTDSSSFIKVLHQALEITKKRWIENGLSETQAHLIFIYMLYGWSAIAREILQNNINCDTEETASIIGQFISHGLTSFFVKQD